MVTSSCYGSFTKKEINFQRGLQIFLQSHSTQCQNRVRCTLVLTFITCYRFSSPLIVCPLLCLAYTWHQLVHVYMKRSWEKNSFKSPWCMNNGNSGETGWSLLLICGLWLVVRINASKDKNLTSPQGVTE